jgi:cytochrome c-type biogenesis protein CcmH
MTWIFAILLAAIAMALAVLALRLPRRAWEIFALALVLGLTGYAWQANPGLPAAPSTPSASITPSDGDQMIAARKRFTGEEEPLPRHILVSDAFARKGQFADAAGLLRGTLANEPRDAVAWTALGNALVAHAGDRLTPAAITAFARAQAIDPDNAAPDFFLGAALIRAGEYEQGRDIWASRLAQAPADAPWREELAVRLQRAQTLIEQSAAQPGESPRTGRDPA